VNITMRDGRKFSGTPIQIVQGMRSVAFQQQEASIDDYITWVVDNAQRGNEVALNVTGSTEDERALSLLDELKRTGLAT
jgi:hypothetical protein